MVGDADATRRRLREAAAVEFAAYGIAGARVDRIAAAAKSNKAQIYHYFGSKDGLFEAVFEDLVVRTVRTVPIDVTDLPEYAGRLFDGYVEHPEVARLAAWYRLERAETRPMLDALLASYQDKVAKIAAAQRAGQLPTHFGPVALLALVIHTAAFWSASNPELTSLDESTTRKHRRKVVTDAVAAILAVS
jgi:AcrR family transcriptional regulator